MSTSAFDTPSLPQRILPLFRGFDWPLIGLLLLLSGIGLVAMYSSGFDHGTRFYDHGRNMLLAAGILFVVAQVPPQRLMVLAVPLYALGVALLVAVALFGITKKGATRWINVGVVIQPSEIMKIAMPLMLAWWFQKREGQLRAAEFIVAGVLLLIPVGLIMKQPDLGTSLLVMAAGLSVIFFAGLPWKLVAPPVLLGALGIALIVWYEPQLCADGVRWSVLRDYQQQRICTLLDPTRDPLGKGFMSGTQTHLEFIPERTTDFIFAAFSEEFGLAGNLVLICCFILLVWRALVIAAHAGTLFGRLMAGAVAVIFFVYSFVNMGMVSGILPVVGVPLPFVSYGGTAMVTLGLALGVLMSVARAQHQPEEDPPDTFQGGL